MDSKAESDFSIKLHIEILTNKLVLSILLGIAAIVFSVLMLLIGNSIIFGGIFFASMAFLLLYIPLLELYVIAHIIRKWDAVTIFNDKDDERHINKIAARLLTAAFISVVISFIPSYIFLGIYGGGSILRAFWALLILLIASILGLMSFKLYSKIPDQLLVRIASIFSVVISLAMLTAMIYLSSYFDYFVQHYNYSKKTEAFSGSSELLHHTIIVPTLDIPLEKNKNVIWCSSFQLAWNEMKNKVVGAPIQLRGAEEIAARLNNAIQSANDISPDSFYVAAGRIKDGIIGKIQKDLASKFPKHSVPESENYIQEAILAFSYLTVTVPFRYPFCQVKDDFFFTDSNEIKTDIEAFGVWEHGPRYESMREQVEILYCTQDYHETDIDSQMKEFVIDLCKYNDSYQIIAAVVKPKDSINKTLDYINMQIKDYKKKIFYQPSLGANDVLIVPEMFWKIDHSFKELIGKTVSNANPAMPIVEAYQGINFRLDRKGVVLESESRLITSSSPKYFKFNRPFMLYIKKRDSAQPFFVMWVNNAELLNKK